MTAPHAFLDILANTQVRDAYLAGRISIVLSKDLETILWANGAGARFLGFRTVADSIDVDSGFDNLTRLQIENGLTTQRPVKVSGIPNAVDFVVNPIEIEQLGNVVFLRSIVAVVTQGAHVDLTDGLSDEATEAVVLDIKGNILSQTEGFLPKFVADEDLIALLHEVQSGNGIKKQLLKNYSDMPVGILELNKQPAIFLMIIAKPELKDQNPGNEVDNKQPFIYDNSRFPLLFSWKVDQNNVFTYVSPELKSAVGAKYGDIIDKSFIDIMKEWDIDNNDAMRTLLKSHKAWSQCKIYWPVDDNDRQVEIEFSALPLYLRDRKFSGYRGFGVINEAKITNKRNNLKRAHNHGPRGLSDQEYEAFSEIARKLKADILAVELPKTLRSIENDDDNQAVSSVISDLQEKKIRETNAIPANKQSSRSDKELDNVQLEKINNTVDAIKKYALSSSHNILDEFSDDDELKVDKVAHSPLDRRTHGDNNFAKIINFNLKDEAIEEQVENISTANETTRNILPPLDDEYKFTDDNDEVGDISNRDHAHDSYRNNFKKIVHRIKDENDIKSEVEEKADLAFLGRPILESNSTPPISDIASNENDLANVFALNDTFEGSLEKERSKDDALINAFLSDKKTSNDLKKDQPSIDETSTHVLGVDIVRDKKYFDDAFVSLQRLLEENGVDSLEQPKEEVLNFWDEKFDYDQDFNALSEVPSSEEGSVLQENIVPDIDTIMEQAVNSNHQKLPVNDSISPSLSEDFNPLEIGSLENAFIPLQENMHQGPSSLDDTHLDALDNYGDRLHFNHVEALRNFDSAAHVNDSSRIAEPRQSILSSYRNEFTLLQNLPLATLIYREKRVLFASDELLRLTGFPTLSTFRAHGILTNILQEWLPHNILVGSDDQIWSVRVQTRIVTWSDGRDATMICFGHLEKQNAVNEEHYKALQHKAVELSILLNLISDGILILDVNGVIHSVNEAAQRMLDFDGEHIKGKNFSQFFAHKNLEVINQYFDQIKKTGEKPAVGDGHEVFSIRKNGDGIRLFVSFGKMELDEGYFLMMRDLSITHAGSAELMIAHHQAEEESQRKSRYLALVSHEIRTPLNAIIGLAELILEEKFGSLDNDRYRGYLSDIISSGGHIMTLVNDLLDVAKITEGQMSINIRNISIVSILKDALGLMAPQANTGRIIMRSNIAPNLPDIAADKRSVKQIVLNLLSNAIRFTPPGGQIIISALRHESAGVLLRVRDSGIGMSKTELEEAMLPFHQVKQPIVDDDNDNSYNRGTGLGLPLTKALVDANNARFSLASEPAHGTVAEVIFPLAVNSLDDERSDNDHRNADLHDHNEY